MTNRKISGLMFDLVHQTISAKINKYKDSIIMRAWFITGTNEIELKQPNSLFFTLLNSLFLTAD